MADSNSSKKDAKKIAFTLTDSEGRKIELQMDEEISPDDTAAKIRAYAAALGFNLPNQSELAKSVSGSKQTTSQSNQLNENQDIEFDRLPKIDRLKLLIRSISEYENQWFSAKYILQLYKNYIDQEIPHSTISTYLARLHKDNILKRKGSRRELEYCLVPEHKNKIIHVKFSKESDMTVIHHVID